MAEPSQVRPSRLQYWSVGKAAIERLVAVGANLVFLLQPIPLCLGRVVPAWGIYPPFPAVRCAEVNTRPFPSVGALLLTSSRSLHFWRHRDASGYDNTQGVEKVAAKM